MCVYAEPKGGYISARFVKFITSYVLGGSLSYLNQQQWKNPWSLHCRGVVGGEVENVENVHGSLPWH